MREIRMELPRQKEVSKFYHVGRKKREIAIYPNNIFTVEKRAYKYDNGTTLREVEIFLNNYDSMQEKELRDFIRSEKKDTDNIKYGYFGKQISDIAQELNCHESQIEKIGCGGIKINIRKFL